MFGAAAALSLALAGAGLTSDASKNINKKQVDTRLLPFTVGMTISCPGSGQIWGTKKMDESLARLQALGISDVAIHPYAWVGRDGTVRFTPAARMDYLRRAVAYAKARGVRLFWKPHLGYWGRFSWRGEITFSSDAAWRRFFRDYEAFIVDQARFAQKVGAPIFSVGLEYERTVHDRRWRRIIAAVRAVYTGTLTYGANWDGIERVPFWDALDVIGVQAYFPLAGARGDDVKKADLRRGWKRVLDRLRPLSERYGKQILFTEIGYARSEALAQRPWEAATDSGPAAVALRRRAMEVAFEVLPQQPFLRGMYWWKWLPGAGFWDRDFSMEDPEALAVLSAFAQRSAGR